MSVIVPLDAEKQKSLNVYTENGIEVEIATVHSIKGETHIATLYLETYYNKKHETERVSEQLNGLAYTENDEDTKSTLRVMYVGMSRPKLLLCMAVEESRFKLLNYNELRKIWNVVEIEH